MRPFFRIILGFVVLVAGGPAALVQGARGQGATGQPPPAFPILNVNAVPYLKPAGRVQYEKFLQLNTPRAVAIASNGRIGWVAGVATLDQAREKALETCALSGVTDCRIYAENLSVVWGDHPPPPPPAPPGPLLGAMGYSFVPDPRFLWYGPQAARGLYVWAHGRDMHDDRGAQPPDYIRIFNNAGFDVVRFDRAPENDNTANAAGWLHSGLATLRRMGWRMIIAGGQSRGAWNSLQILDTPGLADVVIAVSPAANGTDPGRVNFSGQTELWSIAHAARAPAARVAVVQFAGDPYAGNEDERTATLLSQLRPRVGKFLLIDRPPGLTGHGGGNTSAFALRYAACLYRFATAAAPPDHC
jgi:hypothetical protein